MPHFYGLPLDLCGKRRIRIAAIFTKCNAIRKTCRIFTARGAAVQDGALRRSTRRGRRRSTRRGRRRSTRRGTAVQPSKCGAFGGRKVAHMPPCFQVPLWHVCCILFDSYRRILVDMYRPTHRVIRLAKPALALRKLSLSLPGPSARKTWANTLTEQCQRFSAWSTDRERTVGRGRGGLGGEGEKNNDETDSNS